MDDRIFDREHLTLREFADFVGLPESTLRYYDRERVFHPNTAATGTRGQGRRYGSTQITSINMIHVLTEIGVPLGTIRELAETRTPEKSLKLLRKAKNEVDDKIGFYSDVNLLIDVYLGLLHDGICATEDEIAVTKMSAIQIVMGDVNDYTDTVGFVREFTRFCRALREPRLNTCFPIGGYWESMDAFMDRPSQPERFFSLDPNGREQKTAGRYLVGYTRGYYGQTNGLPERMRAYAEKKGAAFAGPVYNLYLFDELSIVDPQRYLMQSCVAVKEADRPYRR